MDTLTLHSVAPQAGVRGGQIALSCTGVDAQRLAACGVQFGTALARPLLASPTLMLSLVPDASDAHSVQIVQDEQRSNALPFALATRLADNLHPVASPAVDASGTIYSTISGTKGQHVPVSLYKMTLAGEVTPWLSGIANPTSLAFGPDGLLYVSSRHEGTVYRIDQRGTVSVFASKLGIATGLAFDTAGRLYVGDRRGAIFQVGETGAARIFARLEPSMTGYHLAFNDEGWLYVSYPTLSGSDQIYRITPSGEVQIFASGLGRAQGLAFDTAQNLYVVAHTAGAGGVVRITPAGDLTRIIAGVNLVGLAFNTQGNLILTDNSTVYAIAIGVEGRRLPV